MAELKEAVLEDDTKEPVSLLIEHRLPWLVLGLLGGVSLTVISSRFEALLSKNIELAFFIPLIVYMADAVGTQTEAVYIRNLNKKRTRFSIYLLKELALGVALGILFGTIAGLFAYIVFHSANTAFSVGLAMAITMSTAPIMALVVPTFLKKEHKDPAVGSGPFTTVVQDFMSLLIYFVVATLVLLP